MHTVLHFNNLILKGFALVFLTFSLSFALKAQEARTYDKTKPLFWLEAMQDPNVDFRQLQKDFNEYWEKSKEETKSRGYKIFKRWEYINEPRVQEDGRLPSTEKILNELKKYSAAIDGPTSAGGNWSLMAPQNYPVNLTGQPTGMGRINAIAFHPTDPNTIFVGSPSGGIWKTTNHGISWTNLSSNLPRLGVSAIVVHPSDPNTIYLGSGDRDGGDCPGTGVYKSINGGTTWNAINTTMGNVIVGELLMLPSDPNTLYAATATGIYKTINAGTSWNLLISGDFRDIEFKPGDPTTIYAVAYVAYGNAKFYRSLNSGTSWTEIGPANGVPLSGPRMVIGTTPANTSIVWLVQLKSSDKTFSALLKSTNSGLNFDTVSYSPNLFGYPCDGSGTATQATYDLCITGSPTNEDIVYVGGVNNWKSTNGGISWEITTHWSETCGGSATELHADQHVYARSPLNNRLYVGHDGGLSFTANEGDTWTEITGPLPVTQIYKIGVSAADPNIVLYGMQDNGSNALVNGNLYTTRGGDGTETLIDYSDGNWCYNTYVNGNISRSSGGPTGYYYQVAASGSNLIPETDKAAWVIPFFLHKTNPSVMFAGYQNVYRCDNIKASPSTSVTWSAISSGEAYSVRCMEQSTANPNILYVYRSYYYAISLQRTDNANAVPGSVTWTPCSTPSADIIMDIETDPYNENIVYVVAGSRIFKSTDKGMSWIDISGNLPLLNINCMVLDKNASEGLYIGNQLGIWYKDAATHPNWVLFSNGLPSVDVRELEIYYDNNNPANNKIIAGTYGMGLWHSDLMVVSVINPSNFSATPTGTTQIDLTWNKNTSNNDVLIVSSPTAIFGWPSDGTAYIAGNTLPNGGGTVVYKGSLSAYSHTLLSPGQTLYYKIWSADASNKYSAGLPPIVATTYSHLWTGGANSSDWFTPANWSTGSIPANTSNIEIPAAPSFQPIISGNGAVCNNILIQSGATLAMHATTAYTISISGDFTNNGTFNRGIGTVEFNGASALQTIKGNSTTGFYILKVNKGSQDKILEVTSIITLNASADALDISSGTFKLSSNSTITPFTTGTGADLTSTDGIWNNGGTINYGNFTFLNNGGLFRVSAGTVNLGTSSGNSMTYLNNGKIIIEGGTVNVAGRIQPNSGTSSGTYTQSGGVLTVNTVGSTSTTRAPFEINSGVPFTMSGGTIIVQKSSSHTSADYINNSATNNVTGGTLQIGNASTPAGDAIYISGSCPVYNLTISGTTNTELYINTSALSVKNDLTIAAGAALNAYNNSFSVTGNWINNGTFTPGSGTVTFNKTGTQTLGGTAASTFNNLTINGTDVVLGTTHSSKLTSVGGTLSINSGKKLSIPANQYLTVSGTLTNNAGNSGLVIQANSSGSGSLLDAGTGVAATVERYVPANTVAYVSPPVSGATRNVFAGAVNNKLFQYNAVTGAWEQLTIDATPLEIMRGYVARYAANTTLSFTGTLNTAAQSAGTANHVTLTNGGSWGWNLVGNPYGSAIDIQGSGWTFGTDIQGFVSYRKTDGNVAYFTKPGGTGNNGGTQYIPPTQAYWINLDGASSIGLGTTNASRVHNAQNVYKTASANPLFRITAVYKGHTDEATIGFYPDALNTHEAYDAEKMFINDTNFAMVYSLSDDQKNLAINGMSPLSGNRDVALGFEALKSGQYRFEANLSDLDPFVAVYLEDTQTGVNQDLRANSEYTFTSAPVNTTSRFILHFQPAKVSGQVVYDNSTIPSLPLTGVQVILKDAAGTDLATTLTDANGNFSFDAVPADARLSLSYSETGGGWNAADAMLSMQHYTGMITLDSLSRKASDVNGSGFINSVDALMIMRRFVNMIQSFPAGEWVFEEKNISLSVPGATETLIIKGQCTGDVNKSFEP